MIAAGKLKGPENKGFNKVYPTILLNEHANVQNIANALASLAKAIKPNDTFILFVSGHGKVVDGSYHFIPYDFPSMPNRNLGDYAISQERLLELLSKVNSDHSVLIFDTCESSPVLDFIKKVDDQRSALVRLSESSGYGIIAAARRSAFEGYLDHGLLTYVILEAFSETISGQGEIRLSDIVRHVRYQVPVLSASLFGERQEPGTWTRGDFSIGIRGEVPLKSIDRNPRPTHILNTQQIIFSAPDFAKRTDNVLQVGDIVVEVSGVPNSSFVKIRRWGLEVGFVPRSSLTRINWQ